MMIFKNAMKNLIRNKGRTLFIMAVAIIVMMASACTIVVRLSANELATKQKQQLSAQVIITRNDDKMLEMGAYYQELSLSQLKKFSESSFIKKSALYATTLGKTTLQVISGNGQSNAVEQSDGMNTIDSSSELSSFLSRSPNIILIGSNNEKINDDFTSGLRKIKEGRMYEKKDEILIGEELAAKNQLKVGDKAEVALVDLPQDGKIPTIQLTISGIYEDHKPLGDNDIGFLNKSNELFMNEETFLQFGNTTGGISVEGAFYLNDPSQVNALEKEFHSKGMPEYYELSINSNAYNKSIAPIEQVAHIAQLFSVGVLLVGGVILMLISILSIRERKYEIAILRAMGLKKHRIMMMQCIELCGLCLICAFIALPLAQLIVQPVADWMLSGIDIKETVQFGAFLAGGGQVEAITSIPVELTLQSSLFILTASILLGVLGSLGSIGYITKHEPMRLLAERN